jgi:aminoglycoside 6'-N-acetyltransferase I
MTVAIESSGGGMASGMEIRPVASSDLPAWIAMRRRLFTDESEAEIEEEARTMARWDPPCVAFVAEADGGALIGFVEVGIRSYAEGGPSAPSAYIEGIWVEPEHRRAGVARALLAAAEQWGRDQGVAWLGSDAMLDNALSHAWHRAAGFEEIERLVVFGKPLA